MQQHKNKSKTQRQAMPPIPCVDDPTRPVLNMSSSSSCCLSTCARKSYTTRYVSFLLYPISLQSPSYLVERRHRFISTTNLNLEEGCLVAIASSAVTLDLALLCIVPSAWTTKHVFLLLAREVLAGVDGLVDGVFVRTGSALEPVATRVRSGEDEEVGAEWADCGGRLVPVS